LFFPSREEKMKIDEKIKKINEILDSYGDEAIQEEKRPGGLSLWGYKPQYLIDAVNEVLGPDGWGYKLISIDTTPADNNKISAVAQVEVYIKIGETIICKGPQFGVSTNYKGDAEKGALTDAIGKGLSLWGIGSKAYRGLLRPTSQPTTGPTQVQETKPEKPEPQKEEKNGSPKPPSKPQLVLIKKLAFERGVEVPKVESKEEADREIRRLMGLPKKVNA